MKEGSNKGTSFCNLGDESIFVWNQRKYMKTIFNNPATNLPVLQCKGNNEDSLQSFAAHSPICLECDCYNNTSTMLRVDPNVIPPLMGMNYIQITFPCLQQIVHLLLALF